MGMVEILNRNSHYLYLLSCKTIAKGTVEILNIDSHCPHLLSGETTAKGLVEILNFKDLRDIEIVITNAVWVII